MSRVRLIFEGREDDRDIGAKISTPSATTQK
jgi:hypothetical protein